MRVCDPMDGYVERYSCIPLVHSDGPLSGQRAVLQGVTHEGRVAVKALTPG